MKKTARHFSADLSIEKIKVQLLFTYPYRNYFAGCDLNSMWDNRHLRRLSRYVVKCGTKFKSHPAK
jgi:hypothetical protein